MTLSRSVAQYLASPLEQGSLDELTELVRPIETLHNDSPLEHLCFVVEFLRDTSNAYFAGKGDPMKLHTQVESLDPEASDDAWMAKFRARYADAGLDLLPVRFSGWRGPDSRLLARVVRHAFFHRLNEDGFGVEVFDVTSSASTRRLNVLVERLDAALAAVLGGTPTQDASISVAGRAAAGLAQRDVLLLRAAERPVVAIETWIW